MKLTAPFTWQQVREIRKSQSLPTCPHGEDQTHTFTGRFLWRGPGELTVTQAGLICGVCGHTELTVTIEDHSTQGA